VEDFVKNEETVDLSMVQFRAEPLFEHYEGYYQELGKNEGYYQELGKKKSKPPKPPGLYTVLKRAQEPCTCERGLSTLGDAERAHDWYCVSLSETKGHVGGKNSDY
jgi:hypothetical protein